MSCLSEPQFGYVKNMDTGLLSHYSLAQAHFHIQKCTFPSNETFLFYCKKTKKKRNMDTICSI